MLQSEVAVPPRRTSLWEHHRLAGARLVPFAGWELPIQYSGIRKEHLAVRSDVGMFDVSHMGQIETRGPDVVALLQRLLSNDIAAVPENGAQYNLICREDGGILDDVFTYRLGPQRFLTITNAANHAKDLAWFRQQAAGFEVEVIDRADDHSMLAVQGPRAAAVMEALSERAAPDRMRCGERTVAEAAGHWCAAPATRARTGSSC
jgi:aminomethyltransferase